ncbi:ribonuclease P protein component [Aquimarina brevivitae]|uniref:Ribonuclease P protein component n=1 Tax=Aquimarina brevivitae TaxID=323412 RepID=A0A4Q7PFU1_9FLAO|nr:ribonuclease P protein component [Aquimarina brevivitae]RZS99344.1 ribonuclease P protein component [Aquimarina brevivitae]
MAKPLVLYYTSPFMNNTLSKQEKLKSATEISLIFEDGNSIAAYPIRLFYRKTSFQEGVICKAAFSVSKRKFKKAVDRNRIKRLLREGYRKNKYIVFDTANPHQYALIFLYTGKELPDYITVEKKIKKLLTSFIETIK